VDPEMSAGGGAVLKRNFVFVNAYSVPTYYCSRPGDKMPKGRELT